jgi:hypothetical protein
MPLHSDMIGLFEFAGVVFFPGSPAGGNNVAARTGRYTTELDLGADVLVDLALRFRLVEIGSTLFFLAHICSLLFFCVDGVKRFWLLTHATPKIYI